MKPRSIAVVAALFVGVFVLELQASGQAGVYGVIDRVVVEPGDKPAERVQIWGTFALMETISRGFTGYVYKRPARGYLYFKLPPASTDIENTRREWKDLASIAGTTQAVSFGYWDRNRGGAMMTVREASATPDNPDIYYTDIGVAKLNGRDGVVAELLKLASAR